MNRVARLLLNRLKSDPRLADPEPARRRHELRSAARTAAKVRQALAALGIDPAGVASLAEADAAAAELAAIPDSPGLAAADRACLAAHGAAADSDRGDPRLILLEKLMRMRVNGGLGDGGPPPAFAAAPLLSIYAWCLGQAGRDVRRPSPVIASAAAPRPGPLPAGADRQSGALGRTGQR